MRWYRLAAEQGHPIAQFTLGVRYDTGCDIPRDAAETLRWYRLAAEQGHAFAMIKVGHMCGDDLSVPRDDVQSHIWFNLAASRGLTGEDRENAGRIRDIIARMMTADDLSEAQRLAREWDAAHPREPYALTLNRLPASGRMAVPSRGQRSARNQWELERPREHRFQWVPRLVEQPGRPAVRHGDVAGQFDCVSERIPIPLLVATQPDRPGFPSVLVPKLLANHVRVLRESSRHTESLGRRGLAQQLCRRQIP